MKTSSHFLSRVIGRTSRPACASSRHARRAEASLADYSCITARKRVEETLRESATNFRTCFGSMTDLIMAGTPDRHILFTNAALARARP